MMHSDILQPNSIDEARCQEDTEMNQSKYNSCAIGEEHHGCSLISQNTTCDQSMSSINATDDRANKLETPIIMSHQTNDALDEVIRTLDGPYSQDSDVPQIHPNNIINATLHLLQYPSTKNDTHSYTPRTGVSRPEGGDQNTARQSGSEKLTENNPTMNQYLGNETQREDVPASASGQNVSSGGAEGGGEGGGGEGGGGQNLDPDHQNGFSLVKLDVSVTIRPRISADSHNENDNTYVYAVEIPTNMTEVYPSNGHPSSEHLRRVIGNFLLFGSRGNGLHNDDEHNARPCDTEHQQPDRRDSNTDHQMDFFQNQQPENSQIITGEDLPQHTHGGARRKNRTSKFGSSDQRSTVSHTRDSNTEPQRQVVPHHGAAKRKDRTPNHGSSDNSSDISDADKSKVTGGASQNWNTDGHGSVGLPTR